MQCDGNTQYGQGDDDGGRHHPHAAHSHAFLPLGTSQGLRARRTDAAQTKQAYADLQALLIDQGVTFPLFERVQEAAVSKSVHGFAFTSESFLRLNDVWKD